MFHTVYTYKCTSRGNERTNERTSNGRTALSNATNATIHMTSFGANPVETVLGGDVALLDAVVEGFYGAGDAQRVRFFFLVVE